MLKMIEMADKIYENNANKAATKLILFVVSLIKLIYV